MEDNYGMEKGMKDGKGMKDNKGMKAGKGMGCWWKIRELGGGG